MGFDLLKNTPLGRIPVAHLHADAFQIREPLIPRIPALVHACLATTDRCHRLTAVGCPALCKIHWSLIDWVSFPARRHPHLKTSGEAKEA